MKSVVSTLLLLFIFTFNSYAETLTFGVVPQQSAKKLAQSWSPMLAYLSAKSGVQLEFATAKDIPTFEKRLANGEYDIAYMNPYHFVVFSESAGYQALAKQLNKSIYGIIVVPKDSDIQSLSDLKDKTLAFPAPAAFAATIIPQASLQDAGIDISSQYVSSHDSVYLNVQRGIFPAGGGVVRTLNATRPEVKEQLRVLWKSPGFTSHAIATNANVSNSTRAALLEAMLNANADPVAES
ncbi:MAG: phosphate/phosphite/phosphonate ABC transporter substrate-binding protein, partial [Pseudomonadota bacterium]